MRYFIDFSYVGTAYHGWQSQPNAITVQQLMEEVLSAVLREKVALVAAGRTDTGVHARQMIAHCDLSEIENEATLIQRLNAFLPEDIAINAILSVPADAHARFDAIERTYEYWVVRNKNPFYRDAAWYRHEMLDLKSMNEAAALLMDYRDFKCFSKTGSDVKTYHCHITHAAWQNVGELFVFRISADRFLRNMVRAIVGTLIEVGQGKIAVEDVKTIIKSGDRARAGVSVPAKGLYLTRITYPENIQAPHG